MATKTIKLILPFILLFAAVTNAATVRSPVRDTLRNSLPARPNLRSIISFTEDWSRYPSPPVLMRMIRSWFPLAQNDFCLAINADNAGFLGANNPVAGRPAYAGPSPAFVEWYSQCIQTLLGDEFVALSNFYPSNGATLDEKILQAYGAVFTYFHLRPSNGKTLTRAELTQVIDHQLFTLVGDNETLIYKGLGPDGENLRAQLEEYADLQVRGGGLINEHRIFALFLREIRYKIMMSDILRF